MPSEAKKRKKEKNIDDPSHSWCSVPGCNADGRKKANLDFYPWMKGVTFHRYPGAKRKPKLRRQWLQQVFRDKKYTPKRYHSVCSRHFVDGSPTDDNPIPTIFPRNNYKITLNPRATVSIEKRQSYLTKAKSIQQTNDLDFKLNSSQYFPDLILFDDGSSVSIPVQSECTVTTTANEDCDVNMPLTVDDNNNCLSLSTSSALWKDHSYTSLHKDNVVMKNAEVQTDLTVQDINSMESDQGTVTPLVERLTRSDESVRKNFGVPTIDMLFGLFTILNAACVNIKYWSGKDSVDDKMYEDGHLNKPGPTRKLGRFHEYLITLLRIRQAVSTSLLADLFGISESRISQIFSTWTNVMYRVFQPQIKWPSRAQVKKFMPNSFKMKFPDTRVLIDCTEIFIQRPRTPTAQNQTYSNYKSHNTFKCLVGITPSGAFSFVSELWGGNVSDKYITANSGFLDLISSGDAVMADRGFVIRDLLLERKAKLIIPPFTQKCKWGKGKRLTSKQVQETRDIARLRIHVERAIQRLKCFRILSNVIPLSLKPLASQIITIAAFLCNLGQPLVR